MNQDVQLIPAATLILLRERPEGPPEILMVERAAKMAFAAGALVFPGGRVDAADRTLAANEMLLIGGEGLELEERAARIAAVRETIEEVGIGVGLQPHPAPPALAGIRAGLAAGGDFGAMLAEDRYRIDLGQLTLFGWWRPLFRMSRNFDTRFYIARVPAETGWEVDGGETVHAAWRSAAEVLAAAAAGACHIIFPTRCNLQRLAQFASIDDICTDAGRHAVRPLTPRHEVRDGEHYMIIPDDQGYPFPVQAGQPSG